MLCISVLDVRQEIVNALPKAGTRLIFFCVNYMDSLLGMDC